MTSLFDLAVLAAAIPTVYTFICRLKQLGPKVHKWRIIAMQAAFAIATLWAGWAGFNGWATPGDAATIIGSVAWLGLSYKSWSKGVPRYFESNPDPLEPITWSKISGGKKE